MFTTLSAMVVAVSMTLPSASVFGATYSDELVDAYNWAHSKSITTMATIDDANMYGAITRAEMAKMLANWAKDKGETPDTSKTCSFSDTASVGGDLGVAIVESCQLGLMGQGITAFRPYDTISRAEFGTALSRALWDDKYEGGNPYYANHLNALKAAGIMNQIANAESTKEVRGYVMLMLMRAEGEEGWVDCNDSLTKLACELDSEDCPAACKADNNDETEDGEVVKSGDLVVTSVANKGSSVISNWATSELDTLTFKASENITLKSVTLERYGLSTASSVASIWLEDMDGNKVTAEKSVSTSKDTVTLSLKKDYQDIEDGDKLIVVITTAEKDAADLWNSIGFKVTAVDSSAKNLDLSDYSANLYDIIDYKWTNAKITLKGSDKNYNYEEWKYYEVAKVKITATNAALLVNGFTLTQAAAVKEDNEVVREAWNLDLNEFVDDVEVLVDGKAINSKFTAKRDELRVSFDEQEIAINKNSTFTVNVTLKDFDEFGSTVVLWIEDSADIDIMEAKNKIRVSNDIPTAWLWNNAAVYTFNGGKINLTNVKLSSTIDAAAGSDDVVIAQGKIALWGQAIRMRTVTLAPSADDLVESVRLIIGDEEYEATANNEWTVKDVVIEEDADVKVTVDILDDTEWTFTVKVNGSNTNALSKSTLTVEYDDVSSSIAGTAQDNLVGSISISTVKIQPAKGSLTNDTTKKVEFKTKETTEKSVFKGTYTAKKNGNVNLDNVKIWRTTAADVPTDSDITFTVKIDGKAVATIDNPKYYANADAAKDDADFAAIAVEAGKSVSVEVLANVYAGDKTENNIEYKIQLSGKDDAGNDAGNAEKSLAPMSFVANSSITVSTNASMKQQDIVLANKNQNLATFIVKPANKASTADLDQLDFNLEGFDALLTSANADDYFEVLIWGVEADNVDFWWTTANPDKTKLVVSDINTDIEWETKVEVNFIEKLSADGSESNVPASVACTYGDDNTEIDCSLVWADEATEDGTVTVDYTAAVDTTPASVTCTYGNDNTEIDCSLVWADEATEDGTVTVTVDYTAESTVTNAPVYVITLDRVNNATESLWTSYQYKRLAVNSLVKVVSMKWKDESETKYTFDIEYSDDASKETIQSVTFTYADGKAGNNPEVWTNVQEDKEYSTDNSSASAYNVTKVEYIDGDDKKVTLTYPTDINNLGETDYPDYFKVGSNEDRLKAYKDD